VKFEDRVEQVHTFFETCRRKLAMVYRTMFPLNVQPSSLRQLLGEFKSPAAVKRLMRLQLIAGAEAALTFIHDMFPSLDLLQLVERDGIDPSVLRTEVTDAAVIAIKRLEAGEAMQRRLSGELDEDLHNFL
jgi:hypothetical protein